MNIAIPVPDDIRSGAREGAELEAHREMVYGTITDNEHLRLPMLLLQLMSGNLGKDLSDKPLDTIVSDAIEYLYRLRLAYAASLSMRYLLTCTHPDAIAIREDADTLDYLSRGAGMRAIRLDISHVALAVARVAEIANARTDTPAPVA